MKLFGNIGGLSIGGREIARGDDGSFDVPDALAAEIAAAFGLTPEPPAPAQPAPAPATKKGKR